MLRARSAEYLPQASAWHCRQLMGFYGACGAPCHVISALLGLCMLMRGACRLGPARRRHLRSRLSPACRTPAIAGGAHCASAAVSARWLRLARQRHACCASANARGTRCAAAAAAIATHTCLISDTAWDGDCAATAGVATRQRRQRPRRRGCAQALCRPCRARVQVRAVTRPWQHEHAARADAVQRLLLQASWPT